MKDVQLFRNIFFTAIVITFVLCISAIVLIGKGFMGWSLFTTIVGFFTLLIAMISEGMDLYLKGD